MHSQQGWITQLSLLVFHPPSTIKQMSSIPAPACRRLKLVNNFHELVSTPFQNGINALCWERTLEGDFGEILLHARSGGEIMTLDESWLRSLPLSPAGRAAVNVMLQDQHLLREHGLSPILDCINGYPMEQEPGAVRTDVYSFHVDSAPEEADTWLCTYYGPTSEGLNNEEAVRHVDIPGTRAKLLEEFGGGDTGEFLDYLSENCYDLHYAPLPHARLFPFGLGNLWRIAVDYPGSPVPPCIHRAPAKVPGAPPRLLLIS